MKTLHPPFCTSRTLDSKGSSRRAALGASCAALLLSWGCTDARVVNEEPRRDSGAEPPEVVEAGKAEAGTTSANETTKDPSSPEGGAITTPDAAPETSTVVPTDASATSSVTSSNPLFDAGASTVADADTSGSGPEPSMCENLPAAPVAFFAMYGFEGSEDFAFDEFGNYVGVDSYSNLVRVSQVGRRELWAPNIAGTTAGMSILPDGSVLICDVGEGSIKRVYPNGYSETVLAGLEYPNGLDVGPDGFIYVAENNAGRVRRIDPDTGEFSIVAIGLFGPNGVAFGNDPSIMYIGSFEGSGVYRVDIPAPGELGQAQVLSRPNGSDLPEPRLACPDQVEGADCHIGFAHGALGKCQRVANVVDCFRYDRCAELPDGTACDYPVSGACSEGVCTPPCEGKEAWDACVLPFGEEDGVCAPQDDGSLGCRQSSPCDQLEEGDSCTLDGVTGTCSPIDYYYYYGPAYSGGLYCDVPGPCDGKQVGDECTTEDFTGTCSDYLECAPLNPCEGLENGAECVNPYNQMPGTCVVFYYGEDSEVSYSYCQELDPCAGHEEGDACIGWEGPGTCVSDGNYYLYCEAPPCADKEVGDTCVSAVAGTGTCVAADAGAELVCDVRPPCENKEEGDTCQLNNYEYGTCAESDDGLICEGPKPCDGYQPGDACYTNEGEGLCTTVGDTLECVTPCGGRVAGDACQDDDGPGVCVDRFGYLSCEPVNPCAALAEGDACSASFGTGTCTLVTNEPPPYYPYPDNPTAPPITPVVLPEQPLALTVDGGTIDGGALLDAAAASEAGVLGDASPTSDGGTSAETWPIADGGYPEPWPTADAGSPEPWPTADAADTVPWPTADGGYPEPEPTLQCLPVGDCSSLAEGAACTTSSQQLGYCFVGQCYPQENPGGIDGLGVDACGNVYASEYVIGNVWRIKPDGTTELLTKLPSSWIPNIKWGRGVGGFEKDVMFVADRNERRLFGVMVGVPGATEFFDIAGNETDTP